MKTRTRAVANGSAANSKPQSTITTRKKPERNYVKVRLPKSLFPLIDKATADKPESYKDFILGAICTRLERMAGRDLVTGSDPGNLRRKWRSPIEMEGAEQALREQELFGSVATLVRLIHEQLENEEILPAWRKSLEVMSAASMVMVQQFDGLNGPLQRLRDSLLADTATESAPPSTATESAPKQSGGSASERLSFLTLDMAVDNALALIDLMSDQLAKYLEEHGRFFKGDRASGMIGVASNVMKGLGSAHESLHNDYLRMHPLVKGN
jgi:hypothetical protein